MRLRQLALLALLLAPAFATAVPTYSITPLAGLAGGSSGDVGAINNGGSVAGYALNAGNRRNATVSRGALTTNYHPAGAAHSRAYGINDAGQAVGYVDNGGVTSAVMFGSGGAELGTLGGAASVATAINNHGQVTGSADRADGAHHAFRYSPGDSLRDLGTLGGSGSEGFDINGHGAVVGRAGVSGGSYHAFLYGDEGMRDLGTLGGAFSEARAINDDGAVTGFSYLSGNAYAHAFMIADGHMIDLNTLGGLNSYSYGINNAGHAVGRSETGGGNATHAFIYAEGVMTDLNTLIAPGFDWVLNYATDINDLGQIAAFGCNQASECQGFLLTLNPAQVSEPGTALLLLLGVVLLFATRRKGGWVTEGQPTTHRF